jgi:hypothetical protein
MLRTRSPRNRRENGEEMHEALNLGHDEHVVFTVGL